MKKTFEQVRQFNILADSFLKRKAENAQTKLGYAITKFSEVQIKNIIKEYQTENSKTYFEMVEKKYVDFALTDKITGALLLAPKGSARPYLFDKVGTIAVMEAEKEFNVVAEAFLEEFDKKEFEIEPHIAVELPEDLTDEEKEAFEGFVISSK